MGQLINSLEKHPLQSSTLPTELWKAPLFFGKTNSSFYLTQHVAKQIPNGTKSKIYRIKSKQIEENVADYCCYQHGENFFEHKINEMISSNVYIKNENLFIKKHK